MENIPPAQVTNPFTTLPKAPSSPTKRPPSTSHYTGGDCSPSKRQDLGTSKSAKRNLLFADATNSCAKNVEGAANEGEVPIAKPKTRGRVKRGGSKKGMRMEVRIPIKSGHPTQPELEVDVQVDVLS